MKTSSWLIPAVALLLSACASSTYTYTPPQATEVQTERMLDMPFEKAWDDYVAELSKSFFVINNISKDSRIINISFGTDSPSGYVDCGHTMRETVAPSIGKKTYNYETADSSSYLLAVPGTVVVSQANRKCSLDGRVNIYMAPRDDKTLLRVNVRYVWSNDFSIYQPNAIPYKDRRTISFNSREVGSGSGQDAEMKCYSTGHLEETLLNLI